MHRLAQSTTSSSFPTIPSSNATTVSSSDILHRNRVQRELHQAVRDSIVAERILDRQARKKYPLTREEKEEQRMAKRQWEISNATLKRIAEEQTTLMQVASNQKEITEVSEKKRLEMHPRLQQALAETVSPNHPSSGLVQQVFSENTPDIDDFIREQEDALKTVRRKLRRSYWHPPQQQQQRAPPLAKSVAAEQALKTYHKTEHEPTSQDLVKFIRLQKRELEAIQTMKKQQQQLQQQQQQRQSRTRQQRKESARSHDNIAITTRSRKKHAPPPAPPPQAEYVMVPRTYDTKSLIATPQQQQQQRVPPKRSPANSTIIAIANALRKEQMDDEPSLPPSLDEFIHEQRRAFESFQQPPQPQPPKQRSAPFSSSSFRRQALGDSDDDDEKSLPPPVRGVQQRNPFEDSRHSKMTQRKKPPPQPLPKTFQYRPPPTAYSNKQDTPPPFLVYAQAKEQQQQQRSSMTSARSTYSYNNKSSRMEAKVSATASVASKSIPSAPFLGDLRGDDDTSSMPPMQHREEQSLLSAMSDIVSTVVEDEKQLFQDHQMELLEENENAEMIKKSLGMNDHSCCLHHPNQLICEYTEAYKYDKVQPCRVCSSERRAGGGSHSSSSPDNSMDMARVIGDIQQLQSDKRQWRNKTNIMFHGKTSYKSSTRTNIVVEGSTDDNLLLPLTDEEWEDLVRQRVLQVDGWEKKSALKYNPLCERYFRMLQMGVPMTAVKSECINEGNDPRILDMDPELPLQEQLDEMYSTEPQTRHALLLKYHRASPAAEDVDVNQVVQTVISAFETEYAKAIQVEELQSSNNNRGVGSTAAAASSPSIDVGELNRLQKLEAAARLKAEDASRRRRAETDKRLKAEKELYRVQQLEQEARTKAEDASRRRRVEVTSRLQAEDTLHRIRQAEAAARLELQRNSEEVRRLEEKSADASLRRRAEADKRMKLEEDLRQLQKENQQRLEEQQATLVSKVEEARNLAVKDAAMRIEQERRRHKNAEEAAKGMVQEQAQQLKQLETARAKAELQVRRLEEEKAAVEARLKSDVSVSSASVRARAIEKTKRNEAEDAAREMMNLQARHLQEEAQARVEAEGKASELAKQLKVLERERESAKSEVAKLKASEQTRVEAANKALESARRLEKEKLSVAAKLKAAEEVATRLKAQEESRDKQSRQLEDKAASAAKVKMEDETRRLSARLKEEEQARRKAEAARAEAEEASRQKSVAEFKAKASANARLKEEEKARQKAEKEAVRLRQEAKQAKDLVAIAEAAEEELRQKADTEAKGKATAEARLKAEEEARIKAESETARLLDRIADEEAARKKAEESSKKNKKKRKSNKDGRKSKTEKLSPAKPNPKAKKQKSVSVPSTPHDLPALAPFLTDDDDSMEEEIIEEEIESDDDEFIEEEYISDSESDEEIIEEVMDNSDEEEEANRVADDQAAGVVYLDPPPLPAKNKKKPSDIEYRQQLINSEFESIVRETEDKELEEPFEPEAVEALRVAANILAYRKKYYNSLADKFVYFPSVTRLLVEYSLIEEAEKHYWEEEDEFPIEYSAAIRAIACEKVEDDESDDEDMEKFAVDLELHVPVIAAPSPRPSGFELVEGPTDVSDDEMEVVPRMTGRSSSRRSMGLAEYDSDDEAPAPGRKKEKSWMYPVNQNGQLPWE